MSNLNEILRREAANLGLCAAWRHNWESDKTPQELIEMYVKGIDFSLLHDWPSVDFIKANFDRELLNRNLVFVDERINLTDASNGVYVLNGECTGTLWFNSWAAATVYVRHDSRVTVIADDYAKVFVRLYDNADVDAVELDNAVVKVYDRRR